jgi:hypothetical protein
MAGKRSSDRKNRQAAPIPAAARPVPPSNRAAHARQKYPVVLEEPMLGRAFFSGTERQEHCERNGTLSTGPRMGCANTHPSRSRRLSVVMVEQSAKLRPTRDGARRRVVGAPKPVARRAHRPPHHPLIRFRRLFAPHVHGAATHRASPFAGLGLTAGRGASTASTKWWLINLSWEGRADVVCFGIAQEIPDFSRQWTSGCRIGARYVNSFPFAGSLD